MNSLISSTQTAIGQTYVYITAPPSMSAIPNTTMYIIINLKQS